MFKSNFVCILRINEIARQTDSTFKNAMTVFANVSNEKYVVFTFCRPIFSHHCPS